MSALDDVLHYLQRGWAVIPVPFRSKNPGFKGWERLRISTETVGQYFNGEPQNIGVLLGEPSGWLIDVDLDHAALRGLGPTVSPRHARHLRPSREAPVAPDISRFCASGHEEAPEQVGWHARRVPFDRNANRLSA